MQVKQTEQRVYQYMNLGSIGYTTAPDIETAKRKIRFKSIKQFGKFNITEIECIKTHTRKEITK